MRFCPFCSAENGDDVAQCASCARRLPPLPPRRRSVATTSPLPVQPRPATSVGAVVAPAAASAPGVSGTAVAPAGPAVATPTAPRRQPSASADVTAALPRTAGGASSPSLAAPPVDSADDAQRELRSALRPPAAALRRTAPPAEPRSPEDPARRRSDPATRPPPMTRMGLPVAGAAGAPTPSGGAASSPAIPPPPPGAASLAGAAGVGAASPAGAASPGGAAPHRPSSPADLRAGDEHSVLAAPLDLDRAAAHDVTTPSGPPPRATDDELAPPPTRIVRGEGLVDRPFTPPRVVPVPEIPEPGLLAAARYLFRFARARMQRRSAIKRLGDEIKQDTAALDQVLGALGRLARSIHLEGRVFSAENNAINDAEQRTAQLDRERAELEGRKAEEGSRFADVEKDRNSKLSEAERAVEESQRELAALETQRRTLRERRKELERKQKAYLKAAEDRDEQAGATGATEDRNDLRRSAEGSRREAAALEPDRQDIDRKLSALERPISDAATKLDAAKAELDAAKRSLNDAREGYGHRLAELDAEQKRKSRDIAIAEAEIARRLVTLGTLVNLNRIEDPRCSELYERIDRLRGAITARTTEIEKLAAERDAFDRASIIRGATAVGGAAVALIALVVLLRALF